MHAHRVAINYSPIFKLNINHKVLELSGNGLHCSEEVLKIFILIDCPVNSGAAETYTADECKMTVPLLPQQKATFIPC
jgi:hypothetical protein